MSKAPTVTKAIADEAFERAKKAAAMATHPRTAAQESLERALGKRDLAEAIRALDDCELAVAEVAAYVDRLRFEQLIFDAILRLCHDPHRTIGEQFSEEDGNSIGQAVIDALAKELAEEMAKETGTPPS